VYISWVVQFTFWHRADSFQISIRQVICVEMCSPEESSRVTALRH